jgi:hypothetical protein
MSTPAPPPSHELQHPGSACPACSAALAPDQRYCLNCGHRLTEPRVDYRGALGLAGTREAVGSTRSAPAGRPATGHDQRSVLVTLVAVGAIVLALGVGVVLGRGSGTSGGKATVVTVAGGPAAPAASTASGGSATAAGANANAGSSAVTEDWPSGASGWTVELSSLASSATAADVASAKTAATGKGASAVGVLNGDRHGGTPTGKYVIYSGRFSSDKQAKTALKKLSGKFPGAIVLHVTPKRSSAGGSAGNTSAGSAGLNQAANEQHLSGSAYEKASSKLPSSVGTGGSAPPKDNKKAGGGSSGSCIGC